MKLRLHKILPLLPGLRLNIGKTGASLSLAPIQGVSVNVGKKGVNVTGSLPGTGVSVSHKLKTNSEKS